MAHLLEEQRVERVKVLESEGAGENRTVRFEAVVSEGDFVNRNRRMYPSRVLWPAFEKVNQNPGRFPGTVDHPDPWGGVSVSDFGIAWEQFWQEGSLIRGRGKTIATRKGLDLAAAIEAGIEIGFSTRTKADYEEQQIDGRTVTVITTMDPPFVDAVSDPSVAHARVTSFTKESTDMEQAILEALEAKHKAELELAVERATAAAKVELAEAQATTAAAVARAESAEARAAELEAALAERAEGEAETALEAKLIQLTAEDRFAATIIAKAKELGVTLESAETIVPVLRDLVTGAAAAANEEPVGESRGVVTSEEDAEPVVESTDDEDELAATLRQAGLR